MSGVEVLAGIGILCSAMQIVTFGKDALHVYRHVRENGTVDPRLESYLTDASKSYDEMKKQLSASSVLTYHHQQVVNIGEEAHQRLQKFKAYFEELYVDPILRKGFRGKLRVARSGFKTLFHAKELEDLQKNFERYQQVFQTGLIQRICSQGDATALLAQESFRSLDTTQQSMVNKIAEGHTEISLLVSQEAADLKDHVTSQHEETRATIGTYLTTAQNNLCSHISKSTSVVQQDMTSRENSKDETIKYEQLMASLRYPEMNSRKNHVAERFPGTFQWIFTNEASWDENSDSAWTDISNDESDILTESSSNEWTKFTKWLGSESKMFWISEKPGSGKSTLMKLIATNSATREHMTPWRCDVRILSHYLWKAGTPMERGMKGLLLSLTHQALLSKTSLAQRLLEEMPELRQRWSHDDWDLQQLERTLLWVLETSAEAVLVMIDGLDESEELSGHLSMPSRGTNIFQKLRQLKDVKICVSSRAEYVFTHQFEGIQRIRIHELTKYDIRLFASSHLKSTYFTNRDERDYVIRFIVLLADGVFLWVALVLGSIVRAFRIDNSVGNLVERITHMPRDVIELVRDMWARSGDDGNLPSYRASASRYFNTVLAGLTVSDTPCSFIDFVLASQDLDFEDVMDLGRKWEVAELVAMCSRTEKELYVVCHGLIEIRPEGYIFLDELPKPLRYYGKLAVTFTHRCVFDFLQDTGDGSSLLGACNWAKGEGEARILGINLIIARFMQRQFELDADSTLVIAGKAYVLTENVGTSTEGLLGLIDYPWTVASYGGFFLCKCYEWHVAGLAPDNLWRYSGRSIFREDPLRSEFIASMAETASVSLIQRLIETLPVQEFLNSLPAIFRGLAPQISDEEHTVLTRLLKLQEDERSGRIHTKASTGETGEHLQRLVCIWFLGSFDSKDYEEDSVCDETVTKSELAILQLIKLALPSPDGWDQLVLLCVHDDRRTSGFMYFSSITVRPEAFVVVSLATVYEMFLRSIRGFIATSHYAWELVQGLPTRSLVGNLVDTNPWTKSSQSTRGTSISHEQLPGNRNEAELSLRTVMIRVREEDGFDGFFSSYHHCKIEKQFEVSEPLLDSLLNGRCLTAEEIETVRGGIGKAVAKCYKVKDVLSYLISELGHIPGLPMHPWSAWLVYDLSGHDGDGELRAQVDEKSRESFKKAIDEQSQDL
ncbi:hypothetical protein NW768_002333 [Fusarium equiseti]|uniref:NACHT domain-containing protein n=1 Tax=Fusarium equiseti TaxID=61235 RepID=A0ABQ8RNL1_FUSEQ|nr:hypothetical protein NW768_002333 [Fusarium equiseti]